MRKRILSALLAVVMVCALLPTSAFAAESGKWGEDIYWEYNSTSKSLTITGEGEMSDVTYYAPWWGFADDIKSVVVGEGITNVREQAFRFCTSLTSVSLPSTLVLIEDTAFEQCSSLKSITIPEGVVSIGKDAFYGCNALTSIRIPTSVTFIGDGAFGDCRALRNVYYSGSKSLWNAIYINSSNEELINATIHYGDGTSSADDDDSGSSGSSHRYDDYYIKTTDDGKGYAWIEDSDSTTSYFDYGDTITVVAQPDSGYRFVRWTVNGSQVSTNARYSFTVRTDRTLRAVFEKISSNATKRDIDVSSDGGGTAVIKGTRDRSATYQNGTTVTVTAEPYSGYYFSHWIVNGSKVSTKENYSFDLTRNTTVRAVFTYYGGGNNNNSNNNNGSWGTSRNSVSVVPAVGGTVAVTPVNAYEGQSVTIVCSAAQNYVLDSISVRDSAGYMIYLRDVGYGVYSFTMPANRVTITPVFRAVGDTTTPWYNPYKDVASSAWYFPYVRYVSQRALMDGSSAQYFDPNAYCTRAQLVNALFRISGSPYVEKSKWFPDVSEDSWYYNAVKWGTSIGIINGYPNGNFGPNDPVSREQIASIFYTYANYRKLNTNNKNSLANYRDSGDIASWAFPAMQWANYADIITGRTLDTIAPREFTTRAEAAAIIMRFCQGTLGMP